jgi:hypothetical protein
MDVNGWSSTPARGPQDRAPRFIFDVTITYFCVTEVTEVDVTEVTEVDVTEVTDTILIAVF